MHYKILINLNCRMTIILFVALLLKVAFSQQSQYPKCIIQYHNHRLCQSFQYIKEILEKLTAKFQKDGKVISYLQKIAEEPSPLSVNKHKVYPLIIIKNNGGAGFRYQNQLSLVQLQYWTNIYCFQEIQKCSSWMPQPIFPIAKVEQNSRASKNLLQFIISNPIIKICTDQGIKSGSPLISEYYLSVVDTVRSLLNELPIIYKFTHNARNFLLQNSHRTIVLVIYDQKISSHQLVKDKFLEIINFVRKRDRRITYQISQSAKKSLVFVIDRYGSKMITKLLWFLQQSQEIDKENPLILALRFNQKESQKELVHSQYIIPKGQVLDNKFLFWLDQVGRSHKNKQLLEKIYGPRQSKSCQKSEIRNTYTDSDLRSLIDNIKFLKFIQIFSQDDDLMSEELGKNLFSQVVKVINGSNWKSNPMGIEQIEKTIQAILEQPDYYFLRDKQKIAIKSQKVPYISQRSFFLCIKDRSEIALQSLEQLQMQLENMGFIRMKDTKPESHQQESQL